ncbi:MAG: UbiA family prenyltransferase, partial [Candidatus Aenigmatarchaeota archaeon]
RRSDIAEDAINYPERISFFKKYGNYFLFLTFILYVAGLSLALSYNFKTFFIALIPLLIMIAYSLLRLKKYFLLKNILASIGWASSFILAGAYFNLEFSLSVMIIFLFYFFRAMINTIFCDIRDISGDKNLGIKTLPIKIGIKSTKLFLHFLNILSISLILIALFFKIISGGYIILFVALYGFFCINYINKFNIKTLSELIDGELYMLGGLALLERVLFV